MSEWGNQDLQKLLASGIPLAINRTATHPFTMANYESAFKPAGIESQIAVPLRRDGRWLAVLVILLSETRDWTQREIELAQTAGERIWLAYEAARALAAERTMHQALATNEQRLQLAVQSANIGVWEADYVTGVNVWDARSREIFGFPPDLPIDSDLVTSCIHTDDLQTVRESIESYKDPNGSGRFSTDYRIIIWNGSGIRHIYAQGQRFYEGRGEHRRAVRAAGTLQDVTALKRREEALRRANLELEQFAYAAAHDLQEPLRNVGLAAQILSKRYSGQFDATADRLLKTAADDSIRMHAMVKDLLVYSRAIAVEEGSPLACDSNAAIAVALKNLRLAVEEKSAQVTYARLPAVAMTELHLIQVMQNLINNSLKYAGPQTCEIQIGSVQRNGQCVFFVKDNGIGIEPDYCERAFGVFKRLHGKDVPGTGIGLALCKRIVEHYDGKIWIESKIGQGTTVLFTPPLTHQQQAASPHL